MFSLLLGAVGLGGVSVADDALWPDLSSSPRVGGGSQDAAVIIAIEDYAFVSGIPGAQANGRDWYTYMTDGRGLSPGRVKLLENAQASKEEIALAVESARAQVGSDGTLWFVFIGYGAPSMNVQGGLLLGMDVNRTETGVNARGLFLPDLMASLSTGPQSETVMVLDACFSGQTYGSALVEERLYSVVPTDLIISDSIAILSAGSGNEFAGPLPGLGRPAFSYLALGAIRGWGDEDGDGAVSASEVASYTQDVLRALPLGRTQTPQHVGPDVVLGQARETGPSLSQIRRVLSGAEVVAEDVEGRHVRSVSAPEVAAAESWLAAQQATSSSDGERSTGRSGYEMVWIEPGQFVMGSPSSEEGRDSDETQHDVRISRGFYMGVYEVTQGLWADVMGSNPSICDFDGVNLCDPSYPVQNVSWFDAVRFANALSERDGYTKCYEISGETVRWASGFDCNGYRLPTEAEWEYAARGGRTDRYAGTDEASSLCRYGNVVDRSHDSRFSIAIVASCDDGRVGLSAVGAYSANGYDLYDMSGNVLEWCWDWYDSYPTGTTVDPIGPSTGSDRGCRGGAWGYRLDSARTACRNRYPPSRAGRNLGLRLARSN